MSFKEDKKSLNLKEQFALLKSIQNFRLQTSQKSGHLVKYPDKLYDLIHSQFMDDDFSVLLTNIRIHEIIEHFTMDEKDVKLKLKHIVDPYGSIIRQCLLSFLNPMYNHFENCLLEIRPMINENENTNYKRIAEYNALHVYLLQNGFNMHNVDEYITNHMQLPAVYNTPNQMQILKDFNELHPRLLQYTPKSKVERYHSLTDALRNREKTLKMKSHSFVL